MRPVLAGQQVAEPLVRQLVRDQAVGIPLEGSAISSCSTASVIVVAEMFSMPPPNSGMQTWAYLAYGYGRPVFSLKKSDHPRRLAHEPPGRRLVDPLGHVIIDRQVADLVVIDGEIGDGQRDQVADVRARPSSSGRSWCCPVLGLVSTRTPFERTDSGFSTVTIISEVARSFGIVVAGEPVVRVLGLALGPDGQRLLGVGRVGQDEVEPRSGEPEYSIARSSVSPGP